MGYTHYFDGLSCTQELVSFAHDAILASRFSICGPNGESFPDLTMDPPGIAINGDSSKGEDNESFILPANESWKGFCKTGRAPYDEVVVAILIAAMVLKVDGSATIGSDGIFEDWKEGGGVDLFLKVFNADRERPRPRYNHFDVPIEEENLERAIGLFETPTGVIDYSVFFNALFPAPKVEDSNKKEKLLVRYHSDKLEHLQYIGGEKSDWIDLRAAENVILKQGEFKLISLGISVKIPKGYEMVIVPRSSTFKNFGVLQTNSFGVIDESYCGDNDILRFPALAMRDTEIHVNDRICQFRIQKHQPTLEICEVEQLDGKDRGGFGSTGKH